jgi:molybdenum cofactor cytidylyltransferase
MPRSTDTRRHEGRSSEMPIFVSGVILAAGQSSRMGRPKQLLPVGGRPLLQIVIDNALESQLDEIILVLGSNAESVRAVLDPATVSRIRVVVNREHASGQSSSVRAGLAATDDRARGAAILLGDQPGVTGELINRVLDRFAAGGTRLLRPEYGGDGTPIVPGHPVLLARSIWAETAGLTGDAGARSLLRDHPDWLTTIHMDGDPPPDIDDWEDYQRMCSDGGTKHSSR